MRVGITAIANNYKEMMDGRFGRAPYFLVFDTQGKTRTAHENFSIAVLDHGAGIQAAQFVETLGINALITGIVGPKALQVLRANKIKIYCVEPGKVQDVMMAFLEGHYSEYFAPNEKRGE